MEITIMIDFTNRETLVTIKTALIRALNSFDNDIGQVKMIGLYEKITTEQAAAKLAILTKSRENMTAIYNEIDNAIDAAGHI